MPPNDEIMEPAMMGNSHAISRAHAAIATDRIETDEVAHSNFDTIASRIKRRMLTEIQEECLQK